MHARMHTHTHAHTHYYTYSVYIPAVSVEGEGMSGWEVVMSESGSGQSHTQPLQSP